MDNDNFKIPEEFKKLSENMQKTQKLLKNNVPKINIPKMDIPKFNVPKINIPELPVVKPIEAIIDTSELESIGEEIAKQKEEEIKRQIENNENLRNLVLYNQKLVDYNHQLVNLNEEILRKINIISNTMEDLSENIGESTNVAKEFNEEQTKLLLQLINIMESKDERSKLGDFLKGLTGDVAAGLIIGYLQYKLGLS